MTDEHVLDKLAAILYTGVDDDSRLMRIDNTDTLARPRFHHEELVDPAIASDHGRLVALTGDGALVDFAGVLDALRTTVLPKSSRPMVIAHRFTASNSRFLE